MNNDSILLASNDDEMYQTDFMTLMNSTYSSKIEDSFNSDTNHRNQSPLEYNDAPMTPMRLFAKNNGIPPTAFMTSLNSPTGVLSDDL